MFKAPVSLEYGGGWRRRQSRKEMKSCGEGTVKAIPNKDKALNLWTRWGRREEQLPAVGRGWAAVEHHNIDGDKADSGDDGNDGGDGSDGGDGAGPALLVINGNNFHFG